MEAAKKDKTTQTAQKGEPKAREQAGAEQPKAAKAAKADEPAKQPKASKTDQTAKQPGASQQEKQMKGAQQPKPKVAPYLQNRELSWLNFDERVLDQGADDAVPLLERLNFISIFWSNLQEFFMVRVGSLTDLSLVKKTIIDSKSGMTPTQQLDAIYKRCAELYPIQERTYEQVNGLLSAQGVTHLRLADLNKEQRDFLADYAQVNIMPFLSPQIINSRHPFPHLENGALYVVVRLDEELGPVTKKSKKKDKNKNKEAKAEKAAKAQASASENLGAEGVTLGILPMPRLAQRVIRVPGEGFQYVLLEHAVELVAPEVFSMYTVKHTNVICVTRNADIDATEATDENDDDYREHMKRILKKRGRLAPVRLESERPLSSTVQKLLLKRLGLKAHQTYVTSVPLDLSYTWGLGSNLPEELRAKLTNEPFTPAWPACLNHNKRILDQVCEHEVLLQYPYESIDAFVQMLREAAADPQVVSIKITLYRLASHSALAEAIIAAAEAGKQVIALFELRARFDENNNIEWSQRFEEAGCTVIYGFRELKVHSKICCITRQTKKGLVHITQLGTGNYNEKTSRLYTDYSFITTNETIGRDADEFFRNMQLENASDNYDLLWVAPLQIKPMILQGIDDEIAKAQAGKPCGLIFKTNSVTDKEVIDKIAQASQAGVPVVLLVRGISCIVPGVEGYTENVRVVSIVGRLLEHSRIYGFGSHDDMRIYLSSADLMTRNMEKRVEIAWPVLDDSLRKQVVEYFDICLRDTAKLRELKPNKRYTLLRALAKPGEELFDSQDYLIRRAQTAAEEAEKQGGAAVKKAPAVSPEVEGAMEAASKVAAAVAVANEAHREQAAAEAQEEAAIAREIVAEDEEDDVAADEAVAQAVSEEKPAATKAKEKPAAKAAASTAVKAAPSASAEAKVVAKATDKTKAAHASKTATAAKTKPAATQASAPHTQAKAPASKTAPVKPIPVSAITIQPTRRQKHGIISRIRSIFKKN